MLEQNPWAKKEATKFEFWRKLRFFIQSDFEVKGGRMLSGKLSKLFILGVILTIGAIPYLAEAG
jgi:hypothetical protein